MEFDQVKQLLTDATYRSSLEKICALLGLELHEDLDVPLLSTAWTIVRHSGLTEADFYRVLHAHTDALTAFYLKAAEMIPPDEELEYPERERPGEEGDGEKWGLSVLALMITIIEFHYLLHNDEKGLETFLKKEKIPSVKYLEQLREVYKAITF
ncbi:hypothetical protein [Chitinophaga sp. YIM B06452]|uniref:hypothetical protein n=1 Tax=Chitinophaga sp. YIM B06452 TaxID=3082158 RepID=UPI0031FE8D48